MCLDERHPDGQGHLPRRPSLDLLESGKESATWRGLYTYRPRLEGDLPSGPDEFPDRDRVITLAVESGRRPPPRRRRRAGGAPGRAEVAAARHRHAGAAPRRGSPPLAVQVPHLLRAVAISPGDRGEHSRRREVVPSRSSAGRGRPRVIEPRAGLRADQRRRTPAAARAPTRSRALLRSSGPGGRRTPPRAGRRNRHGFRTRPVEPLRRRVAAVSKARHARARCGRSVDARWKCGERARARQHVSGSPR